MSNSIIPSILDSYFTPETMSLHIKAGTRIMSKVGTPGNRNSVYTDRIAPLEEVQVIVDTLFSELEVRQDAFLEIDRRLSKVIQLGHYRIVIVMPPLSDGLELTIVRPVRRLSMENYELDPRVLELLKNKSQGILISGAPGSGKTTFAQALIDVYSSMNKIIKTVESPRDLQVPEEVVQYSFTHGTHDEVRDILLLSRPDYTIYDEVRNTNDFQLYKDLRLTGIGLVGVIHATNPIDSIQRFIGNIELGIVPQVIDTVLFIQGGVVKEVYTLKLTVKTPTGMMAADLARPVIEVKNYLSDELVYELYSFGEQIVVIPLLDITSQSGQSSSDRLAEIYVREYFERELNYTHRIIVKNSEALVYIPNQYKGSLIGKGGENVVLLEKELGMRISIKDIEDHKDNGNDGEEKKKDTMKNENREQNRRRSQKRR